MRPAGKLFVNQLCLPPQVESKRKTPSFILRLSSFHLGVFSFAFCTSPVKRRNPGRPSFCCTLRALAPTEPPPPPHPSHEERPNSASTHPPHTLFNRLPHPLPLPPGDLCHSDNSSRPIPRPVSPPAYLGSTHTSKTSTLDTHLTKSKTSLDHLPRLFRLPYRHHVQQIQPL